VCDLETSRMGAPYIYDISRLRVKDLHSATYIYVVRRLRVNIHVYICYIFYYVGSSAGVELLNGLLYLPVLGGKVYRNPMSLCPQLADNISNSAVNNQAGKGKILCI